MHNSSTFLPKRKRWKVQTTKDADIRTFFFGREIWPKNFAPATVLNFLFPCDDSCLNEESRSRSIIA